MIIVSTISFAARLDSELVMSRVSLVFSQVGGAVLNEHNKVGAKAVGLAEMQKAREDKGRAKSEELQ